MFTSSFTRTGNPFISFGFNPGDRTQADHSPPFSSPILGAPRQVGKCGRCFHSFPGGLQSHPGSPFV